MIWVAAVLAVGLVAAPSVVIWLLLSHFRFLSEQNQTLTAALMSTKNSPYAATAAAYALPKDEDPDLYEEVPLHADVPPGTKLLGT